MPNSLKTSVCIDDDSTFFPLIESELVAHNLLSNMLRECRRDEVGFRNCWRWLDSRDCISPTARAAHQCLVGSLLEHVTHVHAFHGCMVTAGSTYHTEGIKPLAAGWITAEIRKWAGALPAPDSDADKVLRWYLRDYSGKVCAVKSLIWHQENGGNHHAQGSEALRKILALYCPTALERLLQTGEPSIIEFTIPVSELEDKAWPHYVSDLLRVWLSRKVDFPPPDDLRYGGIVLSRSVPPAWLLRRHICDSLGVLTGRVADYGMVRDLS